MPICQVWLTQSTTSYFVLEDGVTAFLLESSPFPCQITPAATTATAPKFSGTPYYEENRKRKPSQKELRTRVAKVLGLKLAEMAEHQYQQFLDEEAVLLSMLGDF